MPDLTQPTPVSALDKFRAEAVDDIVWCIRNNATVQFHEDKAVTVRACGFWIRRDTFHDAITAITAALAQAEEAVR